jgi:hypothetical protein
MASQWRSISCSSSPKAVPCAEVVRSLAPKDVFKCAMRRNRLLLTVISGYNGVVGFGGAGGLRIGLDILSESKEFFGCNGRDGGLNGLKEELGTGC